MEKRKKNVRMRKNKVLCTCFLLLTMLLITGTASAEDSGKDQTEYTRLEEITGKNIGVITGFDEVWRDEDLSQKDMLTYKQIMLALFTLTVRILCAVKAAFRSRHLPEDVRRYFLRDLQIQGLFRNGVPINLGQFLRGFSYDRRGKDKFAVAESL